MVSERDSSMASYQLAAIEPFNFGRPAEWSKWIRRFERFREATGLSSKSQQSQISTLVYSMGDKAEDLLRSFKLTEEQAKKYDTVKSNFESHFVKTRNVIFERARFNNRKQEGESADDFITDLFSLAEHCGYGTLHDEMVRDRIVVGIHDKGLSERMQMLDDLDLAKAVSLARQTETVKKQQFTVRVQDSSGIEEIKGARKPGK